MNETEILLVAIAAFFFLGQRNRAPASTPYNPGEAQSGGGSSLGQTVGELIQLAKEGYQAYQSNGGTTSSDSSDSSSSDYAGVTLVDNSGNEYDA